MAAHSNMLLASALVLACAGLSMASYSTCMDTCNTGVCFESQGGVFRCFYAMRYQVNNATNTNYYLALPASREIDAEDYTTANTSLNEARVTQANISLFSANGQTFSSSTGRVQYMIKWLWPFFKMVHNYVSDLDLNNVIGSTFRIKPSHGKNAVSIHPLIATSNQSQSNIPMIYNVEQKDAWTLVTADAEYYVPLNGLFEQSYEHAKKSCAGTQELSVDTPPKYKYHGGSIFQGSLRTAKTMFEGMSAEQSGEFFVQCNTEFDGVCTFDAARGTFVEYEASEQLLQRRVLCQRNLKGSVDAPAQGLENRR